MSKHTRQPEGRFTAFGEIVLRFPYSPGLVADLKDEIPYRYRSFSPTTKEWTVLPEFADVAISLLQRYFPSAEVPFRSRAQAGPKPGRGDDPFAILHLRDTAPVELIEASYRTLARLHHPDTGGDLLTMQRINGAYVALKARVSA